jgi:hypothetical protein
VGGVELEIPAALDEADVKFAAEKVGISWDKIDP